MAESQEDDLEEELVFDEDDFRPYNMSPDRLLYIGVCIVFNNIHFRVSEYRSRRPGSAVDFRHIERVFRRFGFRVEEKRNYTAANMMDCLRRTAIGYNYNYCAFICFFLSHGKAEKISDRDGRLVELSELIKIFVEFCPQMAEKPKLFFAQMCRNDEGEKGVTSDVGVDCGSMKTSGISIFSCDKDILVSFATTSGHFAYSTDASGSPYIRKLTQVLRERGHKDDIFDVLMLTRRLVEESVAIENKDMCPEFVSTLTRPLIFTVHSTEITNSMAQVAQYEEDDHPHIKELGVTLT